jgi:hypothetical protein
MGLTNASAIVTGSPAEFVTPELLRIPNARSSEYMAPPRPREQAADGAGRGSP